MSYKVSSDQLHLGGIPMTNTTYHPFNRVPPEILSYILNLVWLSYHGNDSLDRFRFPSIPCKIDRFFNQVAISTPILWSYLRVTSVMGLPHIQERIHHRAGAVPLALYLIFKEVTYEEARILAEGTITQSSSSPFQIVTLSYRHSPIIQLPNGEGFWDHLALFNDHPIHSVRFSIEAIHAPPLDHLPLFTSSMRQLSLYCNHFLWSKSTFPDSLELLSIREHDGSATWTPTITHFLGDSLFRSLKSLSLTFISIAGAGDGLIESCTLDSLEHLELEEFYSGEVPLLLASILTPNLLHLSMKMIYEDSSLDALPAAWQDPCFPRLHKLTLEECYQPHLVELIPQLPNSVKCLELIGPTPIDALLHPLAAAFCIQLDCILTRGVPLAVLVSLVEGRCIALQELEVAYKAPLDAHQNLTREGFLVCLDVLKTSALEVKILLGDWDSEGGGPRAVTFERFASSP